MPHTIEKSTEKMDEFIITVQISLSLSYKNVLTTQVTGKLTE